jgi:serine kinase of HPr protein (carbohydrate metabolism regulator)
LVKEFHFEIYDNIVVFGDKIYSKNIFKQMNLNPKNTEKSEDLDIVNNKVTNFNLDDILDKISEKGIKSLSKEEKSFLNNFNKE